MNEDSKTTLFGVIGLVAIIAFCVMLKYFDVL